MTAKNDYVPYNDGKFDDRVNALLNWMSAQKTLFPLEDLTRFTTAKNNWTTAYEPVKNGDATPQQFEKKKLAKAEMTNIYREFYHRFFQYNTAITDDVKRLLGFPIYDKKRTPVEPPTEIPVFEIDFSQKLVHLVFVGSADPEEKDEIRRRKPKGVTGFEVVRSVGVEPKADKDFEVVRTESKSPLRIEYDMTDKGKSVWYRVRWFNGKGDVGQWSEIKIAIVN
ncbi:MAG: hypothetical protein LBL74_07280 [Bacteroidales bacterium]|jgi:hypothetical protein|nr:hypothetical protein [Bacteroidales bacterium]